MTSKGDFRRPTSEDQLQSFNTPGAFGPERIYLNNAPPGLRGQAGGASGIRVPRPPGTRPGGTIWWLPVSIFQLSGPFSSFQYQFSSFRCPFSGFRGPFSGPRSVFDGFCMHFGCHVGGNFQSNVQFCCNVTKPSKCFYIKHFGRFNPFRN